MYEYFLSQGKNSRSRGESVHSYVLVARTQRREHVLDRLTYTYVHLWTTTLVEKENEDVNEHPKCITTV